jgi:hypothetical protein
MRVWMAALYWVILAGFRRLGDGRIAANRAA